MRAVIGLQNLFVRTREPFFSNLRTFRLNNLRTHEGKGDCSLVRRVCSPKVRKSEMKGSSFRRFCSPKVRKSDNDIESILL